MEHGNPKGGHRERRSKVRLSDVHRLVDKVLPKHMPEKTDKPKHHEHPESERRGGGHHKK